VCGAQATMQGLSNLSMRWLNYPAKVLFKSSRVVPTMVVSVVCMKKKYQVRPA
jgi:ABC-type phosphate/phosphonate transport system permease subunit